LIAARRAASFVHGSRDVAGVAVVLVTVRATLATVAFA
jgi:hypothetical protein